MNNEFKFGKPQCKAVFPVFEWVLEKCVQVVQHYEFSFQVCFSPKGMLYKSCVCVCGQDKLVQKKNTGLVLFSLCGQCGF